MKELKLDSCDKVRIIHSCHVENRNLPAFFRALRRSNMKLEKLKMLYTRCGDGIHRHFNEVLVTFSFEESECCVLSCLFWFGMKYQDELDNDIFQKMSSLKSF